MRIGDGYVEHISSPAKLLIKKQLHFLFIVTHNIIHSVALSKILIDHLDAHFLPKFIQLFDNPYDKLLTLILAKQMVFTDPPDILNRLTYQFHDFLYVYKF